AILDTGDVRCWGYGDEGGLGYASHDNVGLTDTPGSQSPVRLGVGRTARALSAGNFHTCVVLDNGQVRCWGVGDHGRLGYGDTEVIGDNEHPDSVDPVKIGQGRSARAIAAGEVHTCVLLDTSQVRCWGGNSAGILGYGNADPVGDSATPDTAGPVRLGRPARAVTAGNAVTCALLDTDRVRCWGFGGSGRLGYGTTSNIGDNEHPESAGPVALGHRVPSRAVTSLTARPKKKRDRRPPYRFTLTGKVSGLFVAEARSCTGRISVIVKRRKKKVARAATALRHTGATCGYRVKFKTKKKLPGRLKATVRYGGSTNLAPAQRRLRLRAG
ncbi:MAG: hypothetical protein Q8P60_08640, partial [Pseudorhodobacter sp.]|nr:hypothetical protein [Pseudorhodobacter sp.]